MMMGGAKPVNRRNQALRAFMLAAKKSRARKSPA
jgi:hypothetical protein